MSLDDVVLVATTYFPNENSQSDKVRSDLSLRTAKLAQQKGIELYVVDGGSYNSFVDELMSIGDKIHYIKQDESSPGMGPGKRQAIRTGFDSQKKFIVVFDLEKPSVVDEIEKMVEPLQNNSADIVVPNRGDLAKTYPVTQAFEETIGNKFWRALTGADLDVWSGIRTMKREHAHYFYEYDPKGYGDAWNTLFIPLLDAVRNKLVISSVDIDYNHATEQSSHENLNLLFDIKRKTQFYHITLGLLARCLSYHGAEKNIEHLQNRFVSAFNEFYRDYHEVINNLQKIYDILTMKGKKELFFPGFEIASELFSGISYNAYLYNLELLTRGIELIEQISKLEAIDAGRKRELGELFISMTGLPRAYKMEKIFA